MSAHSGVGMPAALYLQKFGQIVYDPTVRRCIDFARRWGFPALQVVNLYAYRSADPSELAEAGYPIGEGNDQHILAAAKSAGKIIAAWGANAPHDRVQDVSRLLAPYMIYCLGNCACGCPKHPLYLSADTEPTIWLEVLA